MMHRIQSLLLTMVLFFAAGIKAISIQSYWGPITRQLKGIDKTLNMPGLGALDGYNTALLKTPVLEILYAWQAFDTWEAYGTQFPSMKSNFQPITDAISVASYSDITTDLQAALNLNKSGNGKGGIYIPRFVEGVASKLKSASRLIDWTGFTFPEQSPALSFASIDEKFDEHQFGRAPILPMGTSWDKCPSNPLFVFGPIDSACTKYARYASPSMGPVKCGTISSPSHGTTGIVYRDANGIHFRRFEGWQNISLPMVSSVLLGQNPGGSCAAVIGGYVYNHQLEETSRGLVTGTVVGAAPLHILATDRFGWGHMSLSMPAGGTISPTSGQEGERYIPGAALPIEAIGPDIRLIHSHTNATGWFDNPQCIDTFMCAWNTTGITLSAKKTGFPMQPDFNCDGCYRYRGGSIQTYKYYDDNNTMQSIPVSASLDTAGAPYPGVAGKQLPLWFAFDRTENGISYKMGTGTPQSEADITNGSNAAGPITTMYSNKSSLALSPYLRNFAFTSLNTPSSVLNIQSRYLNPAQKFCTPPFCGGRFLFWRDAWQLPNPTSFTLTFKARGSNVQVAFGTPTPTARAANNAGFDVSYNYAIRASSKSITIEKGANGPITNQSGGNPAPGSKSLTPRTLTTSTLVTAPGLIVDNNETYNDYWISMNNGNIQFGTGIYPGKNVCATATDATTPLPNNYYYCFSGDVRSTDYINIQASSYALAITTGTSNSAETTPNNGQYSFWQPTQVFPTAGRGALVLNYVNTATSTDPNPLLMLGLTTSTTAKQLLKNTQATNIPGAAAVQQQAIVPDYQIQWGTNGNTSHQILAKANTVMTTTVPVNPDGTPGAPVIPTSSTPHSIWVAYNNGTIAYGNGSIIGQNLMSIWSDPSPSTNAPSIDAFIVATQSPTMQISVTNVQSIPDQASYRANPGSIPTLQPLWQFNTPNSGAINFSVSSGADPDSGAGASKVKSTSSGNGTAQIGLCSNGANAATSPVYEIVLNEVDGTAYVRKQTVKQPSSVVVLAPNQVPTTNGTQYWTAFQNGTILLGTGLNPLDTSSLILSWQDSTFTSAATNADAATTPPITQFTLSAANNAVTFNNISIPEFSPYATAFTNTGQTLQQRAATQLAWGNSAATLSLTSVNTNLLYWHQQLQFNQPGSTSFAYTVQKKDNNPLTLYIGLSDSLPSQAGTTPLSGAKYYLTLTDTGTIQLTNGQNATAPAATDVANNPSSISNVAALKKLLDGNAHTLWVGITTTNVAATSTTSATTVTTIKVGIDSTQGTSPIFTYQLVPTTTMAAQKSNVKLPIILGYFGLGGNSSGVDFSAIQTGVFSDPTTYTTTGTGQFIWQKSWAFGQPDEESISFTLQAQAPTGSQSNQPVAIIGLTTSTGAASTATGSAPFNGASYVISIDYTQQVSVMKAPNFTTRLGNVLYSRQNPDGTSPFTPTALNTTPCSANISDNKPHACTLSFDHGLMRLSIAPAGTTATPQPAQQVVWTFADSSPITGISQFSFTSTNNTLLLTNIATLGAQSLDTVQGTFARLLTTLATTPSTVVTELTSVVAQRLHVADAQSASFFLSNVVQVLNDNAEVFTDADRTTIADVLTTALPEPLLQVNGQASSVLTSCIATMTGKLNWPAVIYRYYTDIPEQSGVPAKQSQINAVFNPTKVNLVPTTAAPAGIPTPLAATDPRRILLMYKIALLSSLPNSALNMPAPAGQTTIPSVLLGIQQLTPALIPFGTFLTPAEQKIIASLNTLNKPSGILSNTQDPASILALMPSIADRNMQISSLEGLLAAQYNALANPSISNPVTPLSTTAAAGQASQVQQIMNWLFVIAYNRDELTNAGQKSLLLALQLTQALPFFKGITVDANTFNSVVASTTNIAATSTIATSPTVTLASGAIASIAALPGIPDLVALANTPVNFSYQVAKLVAQQSVIAVASTNDQKRMSFFQTLSLIPTSTASMLPADVTTLNTKVVTPLQGIPLATTAVATGILTESAVISNLAAFLAANANNIEQILKNTQDPSTILALVPTLTDPCEQVTALQTLLTAQRTAAATATPTSPVTPLSRAQCTDILTLLYSIVCNRDALDAPSLQNLRTTLQIAAATPGLSNLTISDTGIPANANNNTAAIPNIFYQVPAPSSPAAISLTPLTPAITTDSILPGQSVPTSYDLTTALGISVPFSSQVEKLVSQMRSVITYPSNDARRQQFFKYLGMVGNTSAIMDQTSLGILNTKVLVPLQNSTLTNTESSIITTFINLINNPSTINSKALANVQSPANLIATIESLAISPILNSRDAQIAAIQTLLAAVRNGTSINPGPPVTQTQYQAIINLLYLISQNRDELTETGMQQLTFTLQLAGSINGLMNSKTSLPLALPNGTTTATATSGQVILSLMPAVQYGLDSITTLATTPPSFHDCVTKLRELLPNIISLSSTDQRRAAYFQYLSNLAGATMVMQAADIATLLNVIVAPLQKTALSQSEISVLGQINTMSANLNASYAKILTNTGNPIEMLALLRIITPQVLQGTRDAQINALQALLIAQRNGSLSNPVTPLTGAQCQTIVNLLYVITQNRDELSAAGMQSLLFTLQLASANAAMSNLGTLAASPISSDDILSTLLPPTPARIADITALANTPLLFSTEVTKLTTALSTILTLADTNATRQAYFQYLSAIITAANEGTISMQPSDLASLASNVVIPLQKGVTTSSEATILSDLLTICNNVNDAYNTILRNTQDPVNMLALLSTMAPLTIQGTRDQQINAIQGLLAAQRNATSSVATLSASSPAIPALTGAHYQIILNILYLIALNRDELSSTGMQNLLTALQLAATNSELINLTTSQNVPLPTNSKTRPTATQMIAAVMPTSPASLSTITALANTPILFSAQVTKLLTSLTTVQALPSTDPSRQAYFQYLNTIIEAATNNTISMLPTDLSNLANNVIIPLQKGAPSSAEATTLANLLTICNNVNDANSAVLNNTQDPASMLALLYTLAPATLQGTRDQQVAALQNLLIVQRNAASSTTALSASAPAVTPLTTTQYQAIMNILYLITLNRDELSNAGMKTLLTTLQLASTNAGLSTLTTSLNVPLSTASKTQPTATQIVASLMPKSPASLSAITALANTPITFDAQVTKLLAPLTTIQTLPSDNPSRQAYFQYLNTIIEAATNDTISMLPADLSNLANNIIIPLQKGAPSSAEAATLASLLSICNDVNDANSAILKNTQDPASMLALLYTLAPATLQGTRDQQIAALQNLLNVQRNAASSTTVLSTSTPQVAPLSAAQYQAILNILYLITLNRDELSSTGTQNLLAVLQLAAINNGFRNLSTTPNTPLPTDSKTQATAAQIIASLMPTSPASISAITTLANTPIIFSAQIAKLLAPLPTIQALPSNDPSRQAYFQYLSNITNSTTAMQPSDITNMLNNVIAPLQKTPVSPNEFAILGQIRALCSNYYSSNAAATILANIQDPVNMIALLKVMVPITLQGTRDAQITALQALLTAQRNGTINSAAIAPLTQSQYQNILNLLYLITVNRDELSSNGIKILVQALQLANTNSALNTLSTASTSTTATPSVPASADDIIAALLPNTPATIASLITLVNTPFTFASQVAKVSTVTQDMILQPSTSAARQSYFQYLSMLPRTTLTVQSSDLSALNSNVVTPLSQTPLSPDEQAVITNLQQFVANAKAAGYQLGLMPLISDWGVYISTLQSMLANQGISTLFAAADYATFMNCLAILLNNREVLQASSLTPITAPANVTATPTTSASTSGAAKTSQSALMQQFMTLLNSTYQAAAFASFQNTLTSMIATAPTDHIFSDRVAYMQSEVTALATTQQKNPSDPSIPITYSNLITKLGIILNATGAMTPALFNSLQTNVITPLLALITNNPNTIVTAGMAQQIQTISNNIQSNQAAIIAQQATFAYQYSLAQLQVTNPSTYVSMLQGIISGQRQGTITFASGDAQTFLTALANVVKTRDNLSTNDLNTLSTTINFALYSDIYSNTVAQNTLQQLLTTAANPIPFADRVTKYSGQVKAMLKLQPINPERIAFFTCLDALPNAPGNQSTTTLNALQTNIITPLASSPLSSTEKTTIAALQKFYTTAQANIRSASYQMNALLGLDDINQYIDGLQDMITRQGSFFIFTPDDYATFASQVAYIVNSRELLDSNGLTKTQTLVTTTLANANFTDQSTTLAQLVPLITQPSYFNDRVTWMATEVQMLVSRDPVSTDPMLVRFFTKLNLLLTASQVNTSDQQFNILQSQVLTPLGSLTRLSPDQQNQLQSLSAQFLALKSQVLLNQTTFQYQFDLSQAQIANTDTYLGMLTNILVQQYNGSLTFSGNDAQTLLGALQALVNNRDILSTKQIATTNTLFTYCLASPVYQDKSSQATLTQLLQQLATPIPLMQLVPKYVAKVPSIIFLPSTDQARVMFFKQLNNMTQSSDQVPPTLATQITTGLLTPLNSANPSTSEQNILKNMESFVANANQKAQSVSYLLQMADDGNLDLSAYATTVASIMQQKDAPLVFSANDETTAVGAFAYICACRELLSSEQLQATRQLISNILFLGKFSSTSVTQLQTIQTTLNTPYLFQDRLNYASQEIKALRAGNANPAGNRIARLIARLGLILKATGPSTTADFNNLQAIIQQLQSMTTMPTAQMQTVNTIAAQMAANMSTILAAQQTFAYNYQQAQLLMNANNLSAYVSALLNIITLKRQNQMSFNTQDYATFIMGLTAVTDHQDAMSATDITNLKTALNYTYYSNGFASYQNQLTALNALLTTPPTFGQRVALNISKLSSIMQLDSTDPNRIQFFIDMQYLPNLSGSGILTDVQNLVTNLLAPIQTAPISATEQTTINTLNQFVASVQQQAVSLTYNLTQLAAMVKTAANTTGQDPVAALITGMNTIVGQITGGITKLNGNDYQTLVTMLTNIVTNNELLSPAQLTQVQTMLQSLQYVTGFASFQSTLTSLYNNVVIQPTFAQRVAKYVENFPQINSAPVGDPAKAQFITMVSSIFSAPGTMTPALLSTLKNQVINPIKSGNFTPDQQAQMNQLLIQHAAAETRANSFSYRLSAAQAEPTQQAEYNSLTQMINDLSAGIMTMTPSDYNAFLSELTTQVALRPLVPNTQSALYSLVALVKSAPTFSTRPDLVSTLTQLSNLLNTPVDPATRITYFTQNTMAMLGKPITNGQRKQFFTMLSQFSTDLSGLPATTLAQPAFTQLIQTLITTLNQANQSPNTQPDEQSAMTTAARELQDVTSTPTTSQTTNIPSLTNYYDVQMPSAYNNTNVALPRSSVTATAAPAAVNASAPVSRFYSAKPIQRLAQ